MNSRNLEVFEPEAFDQDWQDMQDALHADPAEDTMADLYAEGGMSDIEADADTLASAGMGTDEDYGCYDSGGEDW